MTTVNAAAELAKWEFLERAPQIDRTNPEIVARAKALRRAAGRSDLHFAMLAFALARDCIPYVTDTARVGGEDIAGYTRPARATDPVDALNRAASGEGKRAGDDCDAKARLFVALCLAAGLSARMVPRWSGARLAHVSAAVRLGGKWWHAETTLARARLGEREDAIPKEKDGKWKTT